jgi:mannose-6-phosphate isomerase-like protein (cupin superfamily)
MLSCIILFSSHFIGEIMDHLAHSPGNPIQPKTIPIPVSEEKYARLLGGPPETSGMRSGYVVLKPGESVGFHNSNDHEEVIIPLTGIGELRFDGVDSSPVYPGCILYNPPHTEHDVVNTGDELLKYIYIVAKA